MIAFLRGRVLESDAESAVLDVAGVGYQVLVSAGTAGALPAVGAETSLYVHTHFVKDEPLRLYGFADAGERRLFQTLIDVQGVGPRVALAILAGLEPSELVRAIATAGRSAAHPGEGRGAQNRRTVGARAAREDPDRVGGEGRRPCRLRRRRAAPAPARWPTWRARSSSSAIKPAEIDPLIEQMDPARPIGDLVREALAALRRK